VAIVVGGLCLFAAIIAALAPIPEQPAQRTSVRITSLNFSLSRFRAYTKIGLRTDDGWTGTDFVPTDELSCRIGAKVAAEKVGINLHLVGNTCRKAPPSPWDGNQAG
jgi:hypothetical protein